MHQQVSQNIRILVILVIILPCMVISNGPVHAQEDMETAEALVSNVFYDSELRQALMDLGADAGIPIIASSSVSGFVSCEFTDVPLETALSIMLAGTGYVFADMDGYFLVASPDPAETSSWQISFIYNPVTNELR